MAPVRLLTEIPEGGTTTKSWHFKTNTKAHVKTDRRLVNHSFPILHTYLKSLQFYCVYIAMQPIN